MTLIARTRESAIEPIEGLEFYEILERVFRVFLCDIHTLGPVLFTLVV